MEPEPTVLILGAGASIPYGFPSGIALTKRICEAYRNASAIHPDSAAHFLRVGVSTRELVEFSTRLRESGLASIDSFLARNPRYTEIGKAAIALELIPCEVRQNLFPQSTQNGAWYDYLWNLLCGTHATFDELVASLATFRIFTFNYDRSFEAYFSIAASNTFGLDPDDALARLGPLMPVHLYGTIAPLAHKTSTHVGSRSFSPSLQFDSIAECSKHLKVIPEDRAPPDLSQEFQAARARLAAASRVIFLGFGFDPLNCARLGLREIREKSTTLLPHITATTFGMMEAERERAGELVKQIDRMPSSTNFGCLELLRERRVFPHI